MIQGGQKINSKKDRKSSFLNGTLLILIILSDFIFKIEVYLLFKNKFSFKLIIVKFSENSLTVSFGR